MGFAERNSLAGRTSSIAFPDAIKRNSASATATRLEVQITDSNGSPDDPDSSLIYVRVVNGSDTALDEVLYTNIGMSTEPADSTNGTYSNSGSAFWKMVTTSGGKITLYHKTGTASGVEGSYNLEVAWFENGSAVATAHVFRIVDAADLDTMATNLDSVLADTGELQADWANGGRLDLLLDAIPTTAMAGTNSAALASVVGALADAAVATAAGNDDTAMSILKGIIADTNELQSDDIPGTLTTLSTAVGNIPTTAMRGTDSAALASVVGALDATAVATAAGDNDTAMSLLKGIITDTNELQGDDIPGSLTTLSTAVGAVQTAVNTANSDLSNGTDGLGALKTLIDAVPTTMVGTNSAALASVVGALDATAVATAAGDNDTAMSILKGIITDTNELQSDNIPGTLTTLATAVGNIPTTMVGTNSAALASVVGALADAAVATAAGNDDTAMSILKGVITDTNELQGDWANGGRLDLLLDAVKAVTDALPNSGALTDLATASAVSTLQTAVTSIQNNTRFVATVPVKLNRESAAVAVKCFLYDSSGNMEDADSNEVFVKISQMDGTAIAGRYYSNSGLSSAITVESSGTFSGYYPLSRTAAGLYSFFYKNDASHTEENLTVEFGWEESSAARYQSRAMQVSDAADLDTMSTTLGTILADTNELQSDNIPGTLTTLSTAVGNIPTTMVGTNSAALASVVGALDATAVATAAGDNDTAMSILKGIITDTNELQSDDIPGSLSTLSTAVGAVQTAVNTANSDLSNGTDGLGALKTLIDAVPTTAQRGTDSAALASVVGALADAAVATAAGNDDTAMSLLKGIIADTNELQSDDIPGSLTTLSTAVGAVQTAVNTANSDLSNGTDGLGALKTLIDAVPTTAQRGTDSAALASVVGALDATAVATAAGDNDTAMSLLKGVITDTNELQGDWANGGRLDLLLDKAAQAVHHSTFKKYLKNDTTVMSGDPSDDAVNATATTQSTTFVIQDMLTVSLDEGSDATFTDIFTVLKWQHQGTNGGGGGAVTTKWMISGASEANGSAPTGSAVNITGETIGSTTANTTTMSGLLTTTAIAALATANNGIVRFLLCGKVADAQDTCTCKVYKSTSSEITYQV